jgi:uncharacterized protein YjbI with pentapeptide repeats
MANPEHLQILQQGVKAWNAWQKQNEGVRADLREADLKEAILTGVHLAEATLARADLRGANLTRADLCKAILRGAALGGATPRQISLHEAMFSKGGVLNVEIRR